MDGYRSNDTQKNIKDENDKNCEGFHYKQNLRTGTENST